jgi:hypothetical protein
MEFAASLGSHPAGIPFGKLTRVYYRVRYGGNQDASSGAEAGALIKELRSSLRKRKVKS